MQTLTILTMLLAALALTACGAGEGTKRTRTGNDDAAPATNPLKGNWAEPCKVQSDGTGSNGAVIRFGETGGDIIGFQFAKEDCTGKELTSRIEFTYELTSFDGRDGVVKMVPGEFSMTLHTQDMVDGINQSELQKCYGDFALDVAKIITKPCGEALTMDFNIGTSPFTLVGDDLSVTVEGKDGQDDRTTTYRRSK